MQTIAITGATGFVGSALFQTLRVNPKYTVKGFCRTLPKEGTTEGLLALGNLESADFTEALAGVDVVIHTAARAHIMEDEAVDPLAEYRRVNVDGSLNLARQAAQAGVKRFVFVSSIKVNGESTPLGEPFTTEQAPAPEDAYGISKHEAEEALRALCAETGMELVIVRPVLVYGPGVKANFLSMMAWVNRGIPLPLGAVKNKRSLVALDNLIDLLVVCAEHPQAVGEVFFASDNNDLSTTEMLRAIGKGLGKSARLLPVPMGLLSMAFSLIGKKAIVQRLGGSLQVDAEKNQRLLSWQPPVSTAQAMQQTAQHFLSSQLKK